MRTALRLALVLLVLGWLLPQVFGAAKEFAYVTLKTGTAIVEVSFAPFLQASETPQDPQP